MTNKVLLIHGLFTGRYKAKRYINGLHIGFLEIKFGSVKDCFYFSYFEDFLKTYVC